MCCKFCWKYSKSFRAQNDIFAADKIEYTHRPSYHRVAAQAKKIRDERHGPTSWVSITLREGKYRQVRKMTAVVGFATLRLVRVRIGEITLNKMQPGEVIKTSSF